MEEKDPYPVNAIPIVFTMFLFMGDAGIGGAMSVLVGVVFYQWRAKKKLKFNRWVMLFCFLAYLWLTVYTLSNLSPRCFMGRQQVDCGMFMNLSAAAGLYP